MKRFVVVTNPRDKSPRHVPMFRPVVLASRNAFLNKPKRRKTKARKIKRRKASRNAVTTAFNRRPGRNVVPLPVTTALNRRRKPRRTRSRVVPVFVAPSVNRRRRGSSAKRTRGRSAKHGGRKMATAAQRAWRKKFAKLYGGKKSSRKRRKAHRNKRGTPLSGKIYRPSLSRKGGLRSMKRRLGKQYKKAIRKAASIARRKSSGRRRKAANNPVYTVFNRRRRKSGMSSRKARSMAMKRWHGKRRRAHRNPDILGGLKRAASMDTVQQGLAVLAGAVVATGAPSLLPTWNQGWSGLFLSLAAAGVAGVAASFLAPRFLTPIAAGGVVVVGLRLVAQFAPRALVWAAPGAGAQAGFLLPATRARSGIGGYLNPPPGAISLAGKGRVSGFARAAGEGFRSPRV